MIKGQHMYSKPNTSICEQDFNHQSYETHVTKIILNHMKHQKLKTMSLN